MTGLLRLLDPNKPDSVVHAAAAVAPCSIVELRLGLEEVEWLQTWAGGMSAGAARRLGGRRACKPGTPRSTFQFGFTERTIESWLPARHANAEALATAVHHLLHDRRLRSDTFASFWDTLIGVRRRNVSDLRARQVLAGSPWILPEWTDTLLETARGGDPLR